jgi:hypothetical protein
MSVKFLQNQAKEVAKSLGLADKLVDVTSIGKVNEIVVGYITCHGGGDVFYALTNNEIGFLYSPATAGSSDRGNIEAAWRNKGKSIARFSIYDVVSSPLFMAILTYFG